MLIKKFFSTEAFLTVSTPPFVYIQVNLVLLLIPEQIIVRMKSTPTWNLIVFSFHKRHQILHNARKVMDVIQIHTFTVYSLVILRKILPYLLDYFPSCLTPFSRTMYLMSLLLFLLLLKSSNIENITLSWSYLIKHSSRQKSYSNSILKSNNDNEPKC